VKRLLHRTGKVKEDDEGFWRQNGKSLGAKREDPYRRIAAYQTLGTTPIQDRGQLTSYRSIDQGSKSD
jgi:hypothetical protein